MFKRVYYTLRTLLQHPRYWRGIIACPHAEPLHYHHDGCPACYDACFTCQHEITGDMLDLGSSLCETCFDKEYDDYCRKHASQGAFAPFFMIIDKTLLQVRGTAKGWALDLEGVHTQ